MIKDIPFSKDFEIITVPSEGNIEAVRLFLHFLKYHTVAIGNNVIDIEKVEYEGDIEKLLNNWYSIRQEINK